MHRGAQYLTVWLAGFERRQTHSQLRDSGGIAPHFLRQSDDFSSERDVTVPHFFLPHKCCICLSFLLVWAAVQKADSRTMRLYARSLITSISGNFFGK